MKSKRHSMILELIQQYEIDTQDELLRKLQDYGFAVTQATISRDIKELRLVKTLGSNGKYRYVASRNDSSKFSSKFYSIFTESVVEVDYSGNIAVIRCYTGMAQAACASMDAVHWDGLIGTLAGDDTIFALFRDSESTAAMVTELNKLISQRVI